ncbi:MAG: hypothetical protein H8E44_42540 [Planctomycetes bacterium]|nr:hypothetical protein [Planctomycetota bacterium]MBL7044439.1 hypothetical protein [Pirellulaceae bacterium]
MPYLRNESLQNSMLPVDIVLHPSWWSRHEGITFDEDFFFHPAKRVEVERKMEQVLYDRWGQYGLGADRDRDLPQIGPVHLAAGYLTSEMLGCPIEYHEDSAPQVIPADIDSPDISRDAPFESPAFKRYEQLLDALKTKYGYLSGDIGWAGVLNTALDLRGQDFFLDAIDKPDEAAGFAADIAAVVERFTQHMRGATGSTSISVNRNVRHIPAPVHLHSECSNVMISTDMYEQFFLPIDDEWSRKYRPYGIHHCGDDPHRFAASYAKLPHLDFLDVGWGGDVAELRRHLPNTFLNIRLSPVGIVEQPTDEIRATVRRLVHESANPYLTGVCCINMDDQVSDDQVSAIFEEVELLRQEYAREEQA